MAAAASVHQSTVRPSADTELISEISSDCGVDLTTAALLATWWQSDLDDFARHWDATVEAQRFAALTAHANGELFG